MKKEYWVWYPGDFEIYHGMRQNFSREERGFYWPAYWYIDSCRKNVKFIKRYKLNKNETFTVYSNSMGYVKLNGRKYRFSEPVECTEREAEIEIFAGSPDEIPAILVKGETIYSDRTWEVSDFCTPPVKAGWDKRYTRPEQNPSIWEYEKKEYKPVKAVEKEGGVLFDFGTELTAELSIRFQYEFHPIWICYGESEEEALDVNYCYYKQLISEENTQILKRAFRYVYIPQICKNEIDITAVHYYVDIPVKARFVCDDERLNRIWETAVRTFRLCSGIFFIDGVKRDRWIWSGDAYQSYFVNQYLMFDEDINRRTIWALRGNDPVRQHINTIVDYSMYWVISVYNHYEMSGDTDFVSMIYPRMKTMMEFLEKQLDEHGFIIGREGDWIFIDWADIDKDGPVCAEQMLLAACWKAMYETGKILEKEDVDEYNEKYRDLEENIEKYYWDTEKHAYIDSFTSGKRNVTRHANIFSVLFGIGEGRHQAEIQKHVINNKNIPQITTPYFKFYELEILCKGEEFSRILEEIKNYWGGMLDEGAVTFWEEYSPSRTRKENLSMYGDPYGKSLCHAWAASPIYIIGRYIIGIRQTQPGYVSFEVKPQVSLLKECDCTFPIKNGRIHVKWMNGILEVLADQSGGTLIFEGKKITLHKNNKTVIKYRADDVC